MLVKQSRCRIKIFIGKIAKPRIKGYIKPHLFALPCSRLLI